MCFLCILCCACLGSMLRLVAIRPYTYILQCYNNGVLGFAVDSCCNYTVVGSMTTYSTAHVNSSCNSAIKSVQHVLDITYVCSRVVGCQYCVAQAIDFPLQTSNTHTNTHTQTHIHKHTYTNTHTNTHTQTHIHKHTYTNTHTNTHTQTYAHKHTGSCYNIKRRACMQSAYNYSQRECNLLCASLATNCTVKPVILDPINT